MFVGRYDNSIDDKSRMIVPAKFREELGRRCIIAKGLDGCLVLYPYEEWEKYVNEKLADLPASNPKARTLIRSLHASANDCDVDKQGRLTIPERLLSHAGIARELVTIGTNRTIEIWSREKWLKWEEEEDMTLSELAESMEEYGF